MFVKTLETFLIPIAITTDYYLISNENDNCLENNQLRISIFPVTHINVNKFLSVTLIIAFFWIADFSLRRLNYDKTRQYSRFKFSNTLKKTRNTEE